MRNAVFRNVRGRLARLAGPALLSLCLCGCANFWDQVTSRNFKFKDLFTTPDPLYVLQNSTDGDERAQALRALGEPKQRGGSDAEQDVIVKILVLSAKSDPQPLCRLAAIDALGHFRDPRAVQGLTDAFWAVDEKQPQTPKKNTPLARLDVMTASSRAISPDTAVIIQCKALEALGETHNPAAVDLLARVARPEPGNPVETSEQEKEQVRDVKIAAVRALGNFKHYQATEALVVVLQNEKDVALRDRAVDSLEAATGKHFGDDAKAWENLLHQSPPTETVKTPGNDWKIKLVGWFSPKKESGEGGEKNKSP